MSASEKAVETAKEVVPDAAEEVAELTRRLNKTKIQFGLLGAACGAAAGALIAFKVAYLRAETKYSKIADEEISAMREHYQARKLALEAEAAKRPVEDIVKERGYSSSDEKSAAPPMAVQPPEKVTEEVAEDGEDEPSPAEPPAVRNIFREREREREATILPEWDWHQERRRRSPDIPYVIHYDERHEMEGYSEVTLTYYDGDDVLCNERDEIIDPEDRDQLIGEKNLGRFGHGSNDPSIVYIRNDELEIMYEVVKSPNSYAEEVHGFSHDAYDRGNIERMRTRERDEPEN